MRGDKAEGKEKKTGKRDGGSRYIYPRRLINTEQLATDVVLPDRQGRHALIQSWLVSFEV